MDQTQPTGPPVHATRSRTATVILALLCSVGALAGALLGLGSAFSEPVPASIPAPGAPSAGESAGATSSTAAPAPEEQQAQPTAESTATDARIALLVGDWKGFYKGERTLVVRDDGTATMVSKPEGLAATAFAPRLQFEIEWTLEGDELIFKTTGGEPEGKVQFILKLYGTQRRHKIASLDEERMALLDEDGKTEYVWERVEDEVAAPATAD